MSSERQIVANRQNSKKSTGPRTRRGKSCASRNALRHGLAAVKFGDSGISDHVERLAKAICEEQEDPFRYEQAVIIAEKQILLGRVRAARIAALERGLTGALPELLTLERYERRALSRRRRAIRMFDALKE